ncbi:MAG: ABC transporter substrate-binding protein, partial [Deinococcota bacterium]
MNTLSRRRLLKLAASTAASTSLSPLLFGGRACAQVNLASDIGTGVDDDSLVIGMSGDFSSPRAGASIEYYRGSQAVLEEVNEQGGIHDKRLQLIALDDGGIPNRAISNTFRLLEIEQAFCLANYVGDETIARVLPVVHTYRDASLRMVGNLSGALIQRRLPYVEQVYNVRASTLQETAQLANDFWDAERNNIGVFYTADAGGRVGQAGAARTLAAKGVAITAEATHDAALTDQAQGVSGRVGRADDRASSQELAISALRDETSAAVRHLRNNDCNSIICSTDSQTFQYFVAAARDIDWDVPIAGTSLSDSTPPNISGNQNLLDIKSDAEGYETQQFAK